MNTCECRWQSRNEGWNARRNTNVRCWTLMAVLALLLLLPGQSSAEPEPPPPPPTCNHYKTNYNCGSLKDPGSITNTSFCVIKCAQLPYPDFVVEPTYNKGLKVVEIICQCTNVAAVPPADIEYTTSFFGFTPPAPNSCVEGVYNSACRVTGISSDTNCPNIRVDYGDVTWRIVNTNCVITAIQFANTNQWKLKEVGFLGEPAGGGAFEMYDGFTITFEAAVKAVCQQGCNVTTNSGTRVATFTYDDNDDYVVVHRVGQPGVTVALPTSLPEAIGELAATVVGDQITLFGVDASTLSQIVSKINADRPSSPSAGGWKDGDSPCCD